MTKRTAHPTMAIRRQTVIHAVKLAVECQEKLEREKFGYVVDTRFLSELKELQAALSRPNTRIVITG